MSVKELATAALIAERRSRYAAGKYQRCADVRKNRTGAMQEPSHVQCVSCEKFSIQDAPPEWRAKGFGHCALREKFIMHSALREHDCKHHASADAEVVAKRRAWLNERIA